MYVLSDLIMVSNHWFIAEKLKLFNLFWHKKQLNSDFLVSSQSMYKMPNKERKCPCFCFTVGKLSDVSLLLAKITFYFNYSLLFIFFSLNSFRMIGVWNRFSLIDIIYLLSIVLYASDDRIEKKSGFKLSFLVYSIQLLFDE